MNTENYEYPLMPEWGISEVIIATDFYQVVEKLYTIGISRVEFLTKYRRFQELEPAKMTQKQLDKRFKTASGYSIYAASQYVLKNEQKFQRFKTKKE